jgi:hypothetical protein
MDGDPTRSLILFETQEQDKFTGIDVYNLEFLFENSSFTDIGLTLCVIVIFAPVGLMFLLLILVLTKKVKPFKGLERSPGQTVKQTNSQNNHTHHSGYPLPPPPPSKRLPQPRSGHHTAKPQRGSYPSPKLQYSHPDVDLPEESWFKRRKSKKLPPGTTDGKYYGLKLDETDSVIERAKRKN